jgi:GNAT superfamily N-acetyltransferase
MKIRSINRSDRPLLAKLLARISSFDLEDQAMALELIDIFLEQPGQKDYFFSLAVNDEDHPVGYACFGPTPLTQGTFDLYWIVVDPELAGQGVGTLLLHFVEHIILSCWGRMLVIETSSAENYACARNFYLKNGYILIETIQDFYRPGEDRVTYIKRFEAQ